MMNRKVLLIGILGAAIVAALPLAFDAFSEAKSTGSPTQSAKTHITPVLETFRKLPLFFEANVGQTDGSVEFMARGPGYSLFLANNEAVLSLRTPRATVGPVTPDKPSSIIDLETHVLRLRLVEADLPSDISGENKLEGETNYFIGSDPAKWRSKVAQYEKVRYHDVYPGIDQIYYGNQGQLEYDFVVLPGADPNQIRMSFDGAERPQIDPNGELVLSFEEGVAVRQKAPLAYQNINGIRHPIPSRYNIKPNGEIGFDLGDYDRKRPLVIDPVLVYSTFLGGSSSDVGEDIAIDGAGNIYVIGFTHSDNFPVVGGVQPVRSGQTDVFVTKINSAGNAIIYSTYLGGTGQEFPKSIAVDAAGNAHIGGFTLSTDFPTAGAIQPSPGGGTAADGFITKINASGSSLAYSTYLGGSFDDSVAEIEIDSAGNAIVAGTTSSSNFPTVSALQSSFGGVSDGFITKLNAAGSSFMFSTYFGTTADDYSSSVALDGANNIYITGSTNATNFPTSPNALQPSLAGGYDGYVTKLNSSASSIVYSTFLGGSSDEFGYSITVDSDGNSYLVGDTTSTNFPIVAAFQPANGGGTDTYISKVNTSGTAFVYSTYLGGSADEPQSDIAVDTAGNSYVVGTTFSTNFPTLAALQTARSGATDAFASKFSPTGSAIYSTYLGGSADEDGNGAVVDQSGNLFITGLTSSFNFPTVNPVQSTLAGSFEAFVAKISGATGTPTATPTNTPTATPTSTPTATPTSIPTSTPTATPTSTATNTPTNTPTATPTITPTSTPTSTPTATPTSTPIATPTPGGGFEGDIAPRNSGDGVVVSSDVIQMRRFATGLDVPNVAFNEFQRADCAPRAAFGDGLINSGDVIQARRYATGLDPLTAAGGSLAVPSLLEGSAIWELWEELSKIFISRSLRIISKETQPGEQAIDVVIFAQGDELAAGFELDFDPQTLANPHVMLGKGIDPNTTLTVNTTTGGRIIVLVDSTELLATPGEATLVSIKFDVVKNGASAETQVRFARANDTNSIVDAFGALLTAKFIDGQ